MAEIFYKPDEVIYTLCLEIDGQMAENIKCFGNDELNKNIKGLFEAWEEVFNPEKDCMYYLIGSIMNKN